MKKVWFLVEYNSLVLARDEVLAVFTEVAAGRAFRSAVDRIDDSVSTDCVGNADAILTLVCI